MKLRDIKAHWVEKKVIWWKVKFLLLKYEVDEEDFKKSEEIFNLSSDCQAVASALNANYNLAGICQFSCEAISQQTPAHIVAIERKYTQRGK